MVTSYFRGLGGWGEKGHIYGHSGSCQLKGSAETPAIVCGDRHIECSMAQKSESRILVADEASMH